MKLVAPEEAYSKAVDKSGFEALLKRANVVLKAAVAPVLLLLYVDMMFGQAIMATGRAALLAWVKLASVVVTTALEFVLIPWSQARYANGGVGLMLALASGELLMVAAAVVILRAAINKGMLVDFLRGLLVGAATVVFMRVLPELAWFVGVPVCIGTFLVLCVVAGLLQREDIQLLTDAFGKRRLANVEVPSLAESEQATPLED